jgi:hypothetical protein
MRAKTSFTLSQECKRLLGLISAKCGVSMTAVVELAVRALAKKEEVK